MKRFIFLTFAFVAITLLGVIFLAQDHKQFGVNAETEASSAKKNIVVILTDDQTFQTLDYMPRVKLYLNNKSTKFTNAFVTTPLCCPSRASILTGKYVHNHEVKGNYDWKKFNDSSTIATWLQANGYKTGHFGKYLNAYDGSKRPSGWNNFVAFSTNPQPYNYTLYDNGFLKSYGSTAEEYSTDVLADKALGFLKFTGNEPFFLYFSTNAPHYPYTPAPRHLNKYSYVAGLRPLNYNESDLSDKPSWVKNLPSMTLSQRISTDKSYRRYLETLLAVDEAFLKIYTEIQKQGKLNNTVFIITSDNGLTFGEHRIINDKRCEFDECLRVPMLISYPGITTGSKVDDHFVLNIDLTPTIAEIAGFTPPEEVDGESLMPLLNGTIGEWRDDFIIEIELDSVADPLKYHPFYGVRSKNWKYVDLFGTNEKELYNLQSDPYELQNLASDPTYSDQMTIMRDRLDELMSE